FFTKKIFWLGLLVLLLLAWASFAQENQLVAEIRLFGLKGINEQTVRDVIPFKKGDIFNYQKLDLAISYLREWGVFDKIEATTESTKDGMDIELNFKMATVITQVDIQGNYPFLENKIKKYLTLNAGDIYTPKRVADQVERIKEFYKRQGIVATEVQVKEMEQPAKNGVAITFRVKHGEVLRYRNIEVRGNNAYPDGRFISAINTWKPYSEIRLKRALRKLTEFYHLHGYPRAKIKIVEKKINFEERCVDLILEVREGPNVKAIFEGNQVASDNKLKDTITIFKEGSFDSYEIEASMEAIKKLYKERGYPDVQVTSKKIQDEPDRVKIIFNIAEGKSRIIKRIYFQGNENISSAKLDKTMTTTQRGFGFKGGFDPDLIDHDSKAIKTEYSKKGFLETEVGQWEIKDSEQGYDLIVDIPIIEGTQTRVEQIVFTGNQAFTNTKLEENLNVKVDKPLNMVALKNDKTRLLGFYANHGYPYAKVDQALILNDEEKSARILYDIHEGQEVRIGHILIVGDVLSSQKAIKKAMGIKEGEPYSYKKIVESRLNLRRLGAYSAVRVETIGIEEEQPEVQIKVDVDEQRPFLLDLGFGYSTDEQFTGFIAFKNLNSFGWAKHTLFKLTAGQDLSRAEIGWLDPRFLGSGLEMSVNTWLQHARRPAFNYIQGAGSVSFFRRYHALGFLFRYELDRNYFIEGNTTAASQESLRDNTISKITVSGSYDTRDSFSNPQKGWYTLGQVDIFNEIKGNEANFVGFTWQGEHDISYWRFTLSTALRLNHIQTIGNNVIVPTNELLFLGGDDTVRGYSEDSLGPVNAAGDAVGAKTRWIFNEELRFRLYHPFYLAAFYDMGALANDFDELTWNMTRESYGFGIRYITPVGPLRADYGIKIRRRAGESFGRFHLTFGFVF
ncbi:MAG: outer membrane protein assembly factor BamA, partial [Candidatus Margulisbacteria bacterium]|nr:outer membrane protein assembly factor BamA [Candidatus Margulisiibacteriota bacterium]